jgi:hypothetical protein
VDGLATWAPPDREAYREPGRMLAEEGYVRVGQLAAQLKDGAPAPSA